MGGSIHKRDIAERLAAFIVRVYATDRGGFPRASGGDPWNNGSNAGVF